MADQEKHLQMQMARNFTLIRGRRNSEKCDARIIVAVSMDTCLHGDNLGSLPGGQSGDMDLAVCVCVCLLVDIGEQSANSHVSVNASSCVCVCMFVSIYV